MRNALNIATVLQQQAEELGDISAIIDDRFGKTLSFTDLDQASSQAAALLRRSRLQPGDAVLIFQPMSADLYIALTAVFRLGMVAMFLDPSAGREHIEQCCRLYPPQALIASDRAHWLRVRSPALQRIPVKFAIGWPIPGAIPWSMAQTLQPERAIAPTTSATPALLTFTSGSTGQPKAALRTHGFLLAQHRALEHALLLSPGEVNLATLPIFVLANLASGVSSLIPNVDLRAPGRIKADRVMAQIQTHQPTSTAASPAFLSRLVEYCDRHQCSLPHLQKIFTGGAPVFPGLLKRLQQLAPQATVSAVYGSTEAEPIAHIAYGHIQESDQTAMREGGGLLVGLPVPEINVRILPDRWGTPIGPYTVEQFEAIALPAQTTGEIAVSGGHVLTSYLNGQGNEETKIQVEGTIWHRTGDAGYLDEQGRLWLMGRCSAHLQDALGELYPFAVETAASYIEGVRRTALVSAQAQRVLCVELVPYAPIHAFTNLQDSLKWAQIQSYRIYPKLPVDKRHNAKIDYPALRRSLNLTP
ncbi:MAG TPA: AMP-binding protein [Crinalium sp.]|jgi:acyl-CoA synthetase (AMP-forming)/AMP-acid ligase II